MEQETLFTASKWQILKLLAEQSLSPIELAARSNTSVANISQQLRLLEMAGLVKSERVPNRDKGQPRILYSLAGNHSYLIATTNEFVQKKLFALSTYNKIILKIWFYEKPELHYYLEKTFWAIEHHLNEIDAIALDEEESDPITLVILTRSLDKLDPLTIKGPMGTRRVKFKLAHPDKQPRELLKKQLYQLYDPAHALPSGGASTNEKNGG